MVSRYSIQSAIGLLYRDNFEIVVFSPLFLLFMRLWCSTAKILVSVFNLLSNLLACYFCLVYDISPLFWIRCFVRNSILSFFISFLWRKNFVIVLNECLTCSMYCRKDGGHWFDLVSWKVWRYMRKKWLEIFLWVLTDTDEAVIEKQFVFQSKNMISVFILLTHVGLKRSLYDKGLYSRFIHLFFRWDMLVILFPGNVYFFYSAVIQIISYQLFVI